jgi:type II secretory pathway predicted ATPase ExeA
LNSAPWEQLRRLTNTVMGVSHRLSLLAGQRELDPSDARQLEQLAAELSRAAERLRHLVASRRADR